MANNVANNVAYDGSGDVAFGSNDDVFMDEAEVSEIHSSGG